MDNAYSLGFLINKNLFFTFSPLNFVFKKEKFFCKFCGKEVNPKEEKCEECSTRLEIRDKENREFDEFIASLSKK